MMTRGLTESARLGCGPGGKEGDLCRTVRCGRLIVTCCSMHSRNHRCGIYIGKGMTAKDAMDKVLSALNEEQFNALMDQPLPTSLRSKQTDGSLAYRKPYL